MQLIIKINKELNSKKKLIKKWSIDLNRHFLKCLKMVNGNMKNFSPSLGNREVQIKIAVYCHSTTIRYPLAKIKKKNECWRRHKEMGSLSSPLFSPLPFPPSFCDVGVVYVDINQHNHFDKQYEGISNLENTTITFSSSPTSGYLSKGNESNMSKGYLHSHVHHGTFNIYVYISKSLEIAYMPSSKRVVN